MTRSGHGPASAGVVRCSYVRKGVSFVLFASWALALLAGAPAARADVPVLNLAGLGYGHGVGLSQWGAKYAADAGADAGSILATFYPGTRLGQAGGQIRVSVYANPASEAVLEFPQGGEIRSAPDGDQAAGFPVSVAPGGRVLVRYDGQYRVEPLIGTRAESQAQCVPLLGPCPTDPPGGGGGGGCNLVGCTTTTTSPPETTAPPDTTPPPSDPGPAPPPPAPTGAVSASPVWALANGGGTVGVPARGRAYRGFLQAVAGPGLRLVNQLDVETYLKGMGEVPASWPAPAQQAQAIAARTWALRAMNGSGELCDDDRCQVYIGATREAAGSNAAVDATAGTVVTYGGQLASSVYSADAGGISATTFEGFGTPDGAYPYLTTVRYQTPDPLAWQVSISLGDLANRFNYRGTVTDVRVSQAGPSGRALEVVLDGSAGPMAVPGRTFASRLSLRSTLFTPAVGTAAVAPVPPPDIGLVEQALPDDAAAIAAAVAAGPKADALGGDRSSVERAVQRGPALAGHLADGVNDQPAPWIALALLALATATGMARFGGLVEPDVGLADRRRWPALAGFSHLTRKR